MDKSLDDIIAERRKENKVEDDGNRRRFHVSGRIAKARRQLGSIRTEHYSSERRLGAQRGEAAECYWEEGTTLSVSNLHFELTNEQLYDVFSRFGELKRWTLLKNPATERPSGRAEVVFVRREAAEDAVLKLDGALLFGRILRFVLGNPQDGRIKAGRKAKKSSIIEVSNVPDEVTETDLRNIFEPIGELSGIHIVLNRPDRNGDDDETERRVAYVQYRLWEDAYVAMKERFGTELYGQELELRIGADVMEAAAHLCPTSPKQERILEEHEAE